MTVPVFIAAAAATRTPRKSLRIFCVLAEFVPQLSNKLAEEGVIRPSTYLHILPHIKPNCEQAPTFSARMPRAEGNSPFTKAEG